MLNEPPAVPEDGAPATLEDLVAVMAALRHPETGCPWDLAQSFETIAPYTIEEAYEVADAIGRADMADLCEELGDLQLQVVYHARLAEERGAFAIADVLAAITTKMIRRHPHVFGEAPARTADQQLTHWEQLKADERARAAPTDPSALAGVAQALPALMRAQKLQARAARQGFDWPDVAGVLDKVQEELAELEAARAAMAPAAITDELGDLLFSVVNLARHLGVDAEQALRSASAKFEQRFRRMEQDLDRAGSSVKQESPAALDAAWRMAKLAVSAGPSPAGPTDCGPIA
jgi:MazG family protein